MTIGQWCSASELQSDCNYFMQECYETVADEFPEFDEDNILEECMTSWDDCETIQTSVYGCGNGSR